MADLRPVDSNRTDVPAHPAHRRRHRDDKGLAATRFSRCPRAGDFRPVMTTAREELLPFGPATAMRGVWRMSNVTGTEMFTSEMRHRTADPFCRSRPRAFHVEATIDVRDGISIRAQRELRPT
jgi:hypothetical protein